MPYIIVRGNLIKSEESDPWKVFVSGLKAVDVDDLKRFKCGGYIDDYTITYFQHPCTILSALEVLGYEAVISSTGKSNEYIWTMKKPFSEPEPKLLPKSVTKNKISMFQNSQSSVDENKRFPDFITAPKDDPTETKTSTPSGNNSLSQAKYSMDSKKKKRRRKRKIHLSKQSKKPELSANFGTEKEFMLTKIETRGFVGVLFEWAIDKPDGYKACALICHNYTQLFGRNYPMSKIS